MSHEGAAIKKNAHRPNYCSWLAVCVNWSAIAIFTAKSH